MFGGKGPLRMPFPKAYADAVQRLRVPGGFVLLAAFVWLAQPDAHSIGWGMPFCLAGLALRTWAAGHLAKNERLAQSGPYAWVRNPLYSGSLLIAGGVVIAARSALLAVIFTAAFLLVYLPVIALEEQHLRQLFPDYEAYARQVPAFLPRRPIPSQEPFRWQLYRRNQEWKAALGFAFALLVLLWKARHS